MNEELFLSHLSMLHLESLLNDIKYSNLKKLTKFGFKAYSQSDEDGIIQEIFSRIGITNRIFVEFGVGGGTENNTLYLLKSGWEGLWIECDLNNCNSIKEKFKNTLNKRLFLAQQIITKDNINEIISKYYTGDIDLLSVDIDGNDLYVLDAINCIQPKVIICEYNEKFRPPLKWSIKYDENHKWDGTDYHGASLAAINDVLTKKNYKLVCCNITGVNCFLCIKNI